MIDIDIPQEEIEKYSKFGLGDLDSTNTINVLPDLNKKESQINNYCLKIKRNLQREIRKNENMDDFCLQSATDIWEACNILRIPLPNRTRLRNDKKNEVSSIGDTTDDYEIRISSKEILDWLSSYDFYDKLRSKMFYYHECYHLWQQVHFPDLYVKGSGNKIETSALMFEFKILKNFHPSTPKEFLSKILLLVETFAQLQHERRLKK